jgi:hypothetical protein
MSWVILKMLRMPDDGNTHAFAANMIGYLGLREYKDELRQLLTSRHPAVSSAATRAREMLGVSEDVGIAERVATPIQEVALVLSRLRGWGTRSFTYQVERGSERTSLGTVTMAVEVHDEAIKLTDTWDLLWHGKKVRLNLETTCRRNSLLRPTMIRSAGEGDDEVGTFTLVVGESHATVTTEDGQTRKIDFPPDTLTDVAMFRIFTLLPTTEGAVFSAEHVMEVSELNLKGSAEITCRGLEEIGVSRKTLKLHTFVYRRDGRTVAKAWVDSDRKVNRLDLSYSQITDEGMRHVIGLDKLYWLNLEGTQVSDAGLEHLKTLTNLELLRIKNTDVTGESVKRLQQALPNCHIRHESLPDVRGGGFH